ncbi:MAG: methyl-accepting chemotaxis protein, partial [Lachnospiraceae bacterium]|nr:methyl-accepting chemotaxis protein [Lachnospiraceae bacterium]
MVEKLKQMRIKKRLTTSSIITLAISALASISAIILMVYMAGQYNHILTYYAFSQGDIGKAMTELADVRSATRGAIGYEEQQLINQMVEQHDIAVTMLEQYMEPIKESVVTDVGKEAYKEVEDA